LKNQSFHKDAILNSKESKRNANTQEKGYKKRIKQKALSAIFAKKLKEANSVIPNVQQPQIPSRGRDITAKAAEPKRIEQFDTTKKRDMKSDKIPSTVNSDSANEPTVFLTKLTKEHVDRKKAKKKDDSKIESKRSRSDIFSSQLKNQNELETLNLKLKLKTKKHDKDDFKSDKKSNVVIKKLPVLKSDKILSTANLDSTNESTVFFTKTTKEHVGKVLLAKKREDSKDESKISLSDIFSSQLKNRIESDILNFTQKQDISKDNFKSNKKYEVAKEPSVSKYTKKTDILNKRKEEKHKKKIVNNKESDETPKLMNRGNRKISSLFGNNPDIPNIGQRFVKPVNEPVFTKVTFADLNIHPFMVSIWVLS